MTANIDAALAHFLDARASLLYFLIDKQGNVAKANRYAEKLLGQAIVSASFESLFVEFCDGAAGPRTLADHNQDGPVARTVKTKDGLPRTFYFTFVELEGSRIAFGEANHEELDSLQKHFIQLNNELGNMTRELQKKNAELAQLNALKNRFLGMAAHDLRNPSGYIKEYSAIILEQMRDNLNTDQLKILASIHRTGSDMNRIVEDLLDISKIEAGKFELSLQRIDLGDFLEENVSFNNIMAHQKDLRIDWACDCVAAHLWVDPQKITQVINNLLSNAVKFSHPGGKITVRAADAGADTVEISISDTGVGIPDGELSQIFKPFAKLSVKATRGEKSTGLGMVIVKNIVEAHGGTIRVESAPSKGTTVSFTVPRKD